MTDPWASGTAQKGTALAWNQSAASTSGSASSTGSLSFGASSFGQASGTSTGALSLSGSGSGQAVITGAAGAALSLSGIASADAASSGALSLSGSLNLLARSATASLSLGSFGRFIGKYETVVAADGPAAWWRLGDAAGATTVADSSGFGYTGNVNGTVVFENAGIPGSGYPSANFGGSASNFIDFGNILPLASDSTMSVEAWVKLPSGWNGQYAPIVAKGDVSWRLARNSNGQGVQFNLGSGSGRGTASEAVNIGDGAWHHVVGVTDGTNRLLYIDGYLRAANADSGGPSFSNDSVRIASNSGAGGRLLNGLATHVALYDYALTPAQVSTHYFAGQDLLYGTGAITLSGGAVSQGASSGVLTLSGSAAAQAPATSTGALSLSGSGSAAAQIGWVYGTYATEVLADSPLAYYKLDDTSGTQNTDYSGNNRHGAYVNSPTLGATSLIAGNVGTAVTWNGTSQYSGTTSATWMNVTSATIEAWIQTSATTAQSIVARDVDASNKHWRLEINTSGKLVATLYNGATTYTTTGTITVNDGVRHHIVYTFGGGTMALWVDGVLDIAQTGRTSGLSGSPSLRIANSRNVNYFNGTIDEVVYYGTVLSDARIAAHYAVGSVGAPNATGSLSLSGTLSRNAAGATGVLSLSGSGSGAAAVTGSALLTLVGGVVTPIDGAGSIELYSSIPAVATGSLSLSGSAVPGWTIAGAGTGSISFSGSMVSPAYRTATGALSLTGSGGAGIGKTGTGSITFTGSMVSPSYRSATGLITFAGTGAYGVGKTGTGSLTFTGTGIGGVARSGTGVINFSGNWPIETRAGTAAFTIFFRPTTIAAGVVLVQGVGTVSLESESIVMASELRLTLTDTVLDRAPTSLTVTLTGAVPQQDVTFDIDGTDVYTVSADSEGNIGLISINVSEALGAAGSHTLTATQGTVTASQAFTIVREPPAYPGTPVPNTPPEVVPDSVEATVRHWVLQDPTPGGLGSYVFPHNPRSMTSPHYEHNLTVRRSTASDGKNHIFQGGRAPKEWQFSGYCPSQLHQEAIMAFRNLNRRFYVIDHHGRAWIVVFNNAEFVPRLRQNYNGQDTDWGSDFTITATVLDQDYEVVT